MGGAVDDAARAIRDADVVLVMCGSGHGLIPCGEALCAGNMYEELCMTRPSDFCHAVRVQDPSLFYGFWGRLYNMSADADGGSLVKFLKNLRDRVCAKQIVKTIEGDLPSFFLYCQAYDAIVAEAIGEGCSVHGSLRYWQCASQCTPRVWRLPDDHRFDIHSASLTCKPKPIPQEALPRPPQLLSHYSNRTDSSEASDHSPLSSTTGYPQCPVCQGCAVPNVIDIGLEACNDQAFSAMDFVTWRMALEELDATHKVAILELGCSAKVPTAREEAEELTQDLIRKGIPTSLVRINREEADITDIQGATCVSLPMESVEAVSQIDALLSSKAFITEACDPSEKVTNAW